MSNQSPRQPCRSRGRHSPLPSQLGVTDDTVVMDNPGVPVPGGDSVSSSSVEIVQIRPVRQRTTSRRRRSVRRARGVSIPEQPRESCVACAQLLNGIVHSCHGCTGKYHFPRCESATVIGVLYKIKLCTSCTDLVKKLRLDVREHFANYQSLWNEGAFYELVEQLQQ